MNKRIKLLLLAISLLITSGIHAQIPQEWLNKAKALGISEAEIQQELTKYQQQTGVNPLSGSSSLGTYSPSGRYSSAEEEILPVDYQRFSNTIEEEELKQTVFGREIFTNRYLSFEPGLNIPTPKDYRLSAGDEILINVWGDSELNLQLTISPEGTIFIPNVGPVFLSGMTMDAAENVIRREMGRIMSNIVSGESANTFVSVSLGQIRSIKIHIVGEALAPGTYTLPSFATLFNALYAAGGVNDIGSLRNIRVFRNNRQVATLDIYNYLLHGNYKDNVRLEDNDMIIIGPYEQLITVDGKVKRDRIFEVKERESLQDVLEMAGGFTGDAFTKDVKVKRKTGERFRIATVNREDFGTFLMHDGDSVIVDAIVAHYENRLTISGAVWRPGEYELRDGVNSVKTLVTQAQGLKGDEFAGRARLTRLNPDFTTSVVAVDIKGILNGTSPDVALQPEDILHIPSLFDLRETYTIKVSGAVNHPDTVFPYSHNMTVEDAIIIAGGLKESASTVNVEVARRIKNPTAVYNTNRIAEEYNFTLSENLEIVSGDPVFMLEPFDEIFVRFSPGYSEQQVVKIQGEVTFTGDYVLSEKNARLSDIVAKAGGVTLEAYVRGANLKRKMTEDEKRRVETILEMTSRQEGTDSIAVATARLEEYSVGIDLEKALARPGSADDLVLRDGDVLYIPQIQSTVKISGIVTYPNSVTYTRNMSVRDCLSQAGGYTDLSRRYPIVIYMNGKVATTKKVGIFFKKYPKVEPGCEILVPMRAPKGRSLSMPEIFALSSSGISMAAMVTSLVNTLSSNNN